MTTGGSAADEPIAAVHSRTAALVLLVLLSLVWGVHWVVVKIGLDYMPPLTYAALRVLTGLARSSRCSPGSAGSGGPSAPTSRSCSRSASPRSRPACC